MLHAENFTGGVELNGTIVIADDEPITLMDISEILTDAGYDVVGKAANGLDAVELCRIYRPNIALVDIKMPLLDGLKAAKLIISEELVDAVVVLTSYSGSEFIEEAKQAGVTGYIVKPIEERTLLAQIEIAAAKGRAIKDMKADVEHAREQMEKRRAVDAAKKVLIEKYKITEDEAYKKIRKESMDSRSSIYKIALKILNENQ